MCRKILDATERPFEVLVLVVQIGFGHVARNHQLSVVLIAGVDDVVHLSHPELRFLDLLELVKEQVGGDAVVYFQPLDPLGGYLGGIGVTDLPCLYAVHQFLSFIERHGMETAITDWVHGNVPSVIQQSTTVEGV